MPGPMDSRSGGQSGPWNSISATGPGMSSFDPGGGYPGMPQRPMAPDPQSQYGAPVFAPPQFSGNPFGSPEDFGKYFTEYQDSERRFADQMGDYNNALARSKESAAMDQNRYDSEMQSYNDEIRRMMMNAGGTMSPNVGGGYSEDPNQNALLDYLGQMLGGGG